MFLVQPRGALGGDEELTAVGIGPGIGHAQGVGFVVLESGAALVLELAAPDGGPARTVAERVPALNHEFLYHPVEERGVVVARAGVGDEVLDGLGRGVWEEAEVDVAQGRVHDGLGAGFGRFLGVRAGGAVAAAGRGLFVLDVAGGFGDLAVVGEEVEADFAAARAHEHRVALFGLLEERVRRRGHGDGGDGLFLREALVESQVEGAKGLQGAVELDDAIRERVQDFDAQEGAVQDEIRGFVEQDVDFGTCRRVVEVALHRETAGELGGFEGLKGGAGLLHVRDGGDGFIVGAMELSGRKVEDADFAVREGEGRKLRSGGRDGDGSGQRLGLLELEQVR